MVYSVVSVDANSYYDDKKLPSIQNKNRSNFNESLNTINRVDSYLTESDLPRNWIFRNLSSPSQQFSVRRRSNPNVSERLPSILSLPFGAFSSKNLAHRIQPIREEPGVDLDFWDKLTEWLSLKVQAFPSHSQIYGSWLVQDTIHFHKLIQIHPYVLAQTIKKPLSTVTTELLRGVTKDLFSIMFSLLCPKCCQCSFHFGNIGDFPREQTCQLCGESYLTDISRNVVVTFRINPEIYRMPVEGLFFEPPAALMGSLIGEVCVGPNLGYFETGWDLNEEEYVIICGVTAHRCEVLVRGEYCVVQQRLELKVSEDGIISPSKVEVLSGRLQVRVNNQNPYFTTLMIFPKSAIQQTWESKHNEVPSGHKYWTFLDFIHHPRWPLWFGCSTLTFDNLHISSCCLVFTDIANSTIQYEQLGEVVAFKMVLDHFRYLIDSIVEHGGRVIKTSGDAVMASFMEPLPALVSMLQTNVRLSQYNESLACPSGGKVELKIGIHNGMMSLVPLNGVLDYFGRGVNKAARVQSKASSGEIALSNEVYERMDVQVGLQNLLELVPLGITQKEVTYKGIAGTHLVHLVTLPKTQHLPNDDDRLNELFSPTSYKVAGAGNCSIGTMAAFCTIRRRVSVRTKHFV